MIDFSAYVFYVNRPDLIQRAIESFHPLWPQLTVVDNSGEVDHFLGRTFVPPVPFTYAQSMNWILKDAQEQRSEFIIHFHSDAYSSNPDAASELLDKVRGYKAEGRKWACAWTHYDLLWAINVKALKISVDGTLTSPTYFGDNDAKRRWTLAGWECINTDIKGIDHEGSATINSDPMLKFMDAQVFPRCTPTITNRSGAENLAMKSTMSRSTATTFLGSKPCMEAEIISHMAEPVKNRKLTLREMLDDIAEEQAFINGDYGKLRLEDNDAESQESRKSKEAKAQPGRAQPDCQGSLGKA